MTDFNGTLFSISYNRKARIVSARFLGIAGPGQVHDYTRAMGYELLGEELLEQVSQLVEFKDFIKKNPDISLRCFSYRNARWMFSNKEGKFLQETSWPSHYGNDDWLLVSSY